MSSATHALTSGACECELTLAEKLAVLGYVHLNRGCTAGPGEEPGEAPGDAPGEEARALRTEAVGACWEAATSWSVAPQELDFLEESVSRVRPRRAARGAKKLQSRFGPPEQGIMDDDVALDVPDHDAEPTARAPTTAARR